MNHAVIAQEATPRELYEEPLDRFVADFIGDANLIAAEVTAVDGAFATVRLGPLERQLRHRGLSPGPAHVAIRPDSIELANEPRPGAIEGNVAKATYLGSHVEYGVRTALGELFVIDRRVERFLVPGSTVSVTFGQRGITLVRS
jgi:iron(III) transport system ATP-binding protein